MMKMNDEVHTFIQHYNTTTIGALINKNINTIHQINWMVCLFYLYLQY
jgi:hypothetical protein